MSDEVPTLRHDPAPNTLKILDVLSYCTLVRMTARSELFWASEQQNELGNIFPSIAEVDSPD